MNKKILIKKGLVVAVILLFIGVSVIPSTGTLMMQNETLTELIIDGPTQGNVGELLEYILILTDPEGCEIWFFIDWDDGTNPVWIGPYMAGEEALVSNTWYECGIYNFSVQVEGCDGTMYLGTFEVTIIDNHPPDAPKITGPRFVSPGIHEWTFKAIDPDGDDVYYWIEWGDKSFENWFGPFESGEEAISSHYYHEYGEVTIKAQAKDIHGAIGDEGTLSVTIPKSKQIFNLPFLQFLERFPILNQIIMRLVEGWE